MDSFESELTFIVKVHIFIVQTDGLR